MIRNAGCRSVLACLISAVSLVQAVLPAYATDTEHRDYSIFVDGKEAGSSRMTLVQQDDGSVYMTASVDVKFKQVLLEYVLRIDTKEWWKAGRLVGMDTRTVENSKKTEVVIASDNNQLRMRVNGQERAISPEAWPNSYWKLADARFHNKKIPVLEADSGRESVCDLKYVDTQQLKVGNQLLECFHFRVSGGTAPIDLWFDRYHRLVRQEFVDGGHKTIVQLVSIRR